MKISEYSEQCVVFQWVKLHKKKYPELKWLFSTLNGVKLNIGQAVKAKKSGMKAGVSDIILPAKNNKYSGLFIELKVGKNKPSKEQLEFIEFTRSQGFYSQVSYGSVEAIDLIVDYLEGNL